MKFEIAMSISPGYFDTNETSYDMSIGIGVKRS